MSRRNAPLTPTGRLRPARCVGDDGWPPRRAAERFQVSHTAVARWAGRSRSWDPRACTTAPAARTTNPAAPRPPSRRRS
ncbi:hypothetical protein ACE1SV_74580 [Streptomyces sennicomposti]